MLFKVSASNPLLPELTRELEIVKVEGGVLLLKFRDGSPSTL
ncbi:hypothetical protein [Sulfodiicoccus acidiphilus]|nr:hypothetical protein [Sulfodiicoccus acidiphilus]